jgi:hypothetical protein
MGIFSLRLSVLGVSALKMSVHILLHRFQRRDAENAETQRYIGGILKFQQVGEEAD